MMAEPRRLPWPTKSAAPVDNYEEFIGRLDAASAKLKARRNTLNEIVEILALLLRQNTTGIQLWEQRLHVCEELLAHAAGEPDRSTALMELHEVALKMEPLFRKRAQRVDVRLAAVRARCAEINSSLRGLEKSKIKLTSSRMIAKERESLSRAIGELSGTPDAVAVANPDPGLRSDLQDARHAIILAEALLEAKREK
ncbi:hypothetical protein C3B78_04860 [Arthrobacter sp. PGP41]|uniref:hypothetical protein n=1 Tax=Arthrobacter sp. PGP41 TaxID=2079227 RepID=UPI000CDCB58C|nr:hypothetical protein [Arthrobacter sp. PGP41]AUZ33859.1 hypothetical protein C3B78_04860 [Arthrobacter sp. PGP41]